MKRIRCTQAKSKSFPKTQDNKLLSSQGQPPTTRNQQLSKDLEANPDKHISLEESKDFDVRQQLFSREQASARIACKQY